MPDLQQIFREAWANALAGVNAAEQEAERIIARVADAAGFSPEEVRRQAREFGDRLVQQRKEVERAMDDAVRRATQRFRIPSREELDALQKRLDAVADRVEALARERGQA